MYFRNYYGSFYPVSSSIHKLNPIVKLINFIIMLLLLILSNGREIHLFMFIYVVVIILLSYVPLKYYFNTFYSLRYIYLIIAFICAFMGLSFAGYLIYVSKLIIFVLYLNVIVFTTSPSETIYSIEKFLSLFNIFNLKVVKIATKINNMLRYYPLYIETKYKTLLAASIRGIHIGFFDIKGKLKLHSRIKRLTKIKNEEILLYSELRLYDINKHRTNYRTNKVGFYDILFLVFHLVLLYIYCIEEGLL